MIFGIDNEPIPGVGVLSLSKNTACLGRSIALNILACATANKRKHKT